jgi:hypothetical protein
MRNRASGDKDDPQNAVTRPRTNEARVTLEASGAGQSLLRGRPIQARGQEKAKEKKKAEEKEEKQVPRKEARKPKERKLRQAKS